MRRLILSLFVLPLAALAHDGPELLFNLVGLQAEASRTADFVEGVAAFRAKRPPVFRGQ